MSKFKVFESKYKGHPIFEVWPTDENGNTGKYCTVKVGVKKAEALLEHIEELKAFVAKHNGGNSSSPAPAPAPAVPAAQDVNDVF